MQTLNQAFKAIGDRDFSSVIRNTDYDTQLFECCECGNIDDYNEECEYCGGAMIDIDLHRLAEIRVP